MDKSSAVFQAIISLAQYKTDFFFQYIRMSNPKETEKVKEIEKLEELEKN